MGRRKKSAGIKPWCWYCDREFQDDTVLIQHQKAKHFKCPQCPKRLITTSGLRIHVSQVHKHELKAVPNSLPHRSRIDIEIFGMDGVPTEDLRERQAALAARTADPAAAAAAAAVARRQALVRHVAYLTTAARRGTAAPALPYPKIRLSYAAVERELNPLNLARNLKRFRAAKAAAAAAGHPQFGWPPPFPPGPRPNP